MKSARYMSYDGHVAVKDVLQVKKCHYGKGIELANNLFVVAASSVSDKSRQTGTYPQHKC